ncbi:MAG: sigma-70 family RNA polymerase sigma factor, partial [Planctomycetota bacterium]|nr:sigma-70 family RNA polymerase sigma factor [Planctomycetota bacterium]
MTDPIPRARTDELLAEAGWIRSLARSLAGDSARAADLEQETWRVALERPPRVDRGSAGHGRSGLRGWLASVARSLARRGWRDERVRSHHEAAGARKGLVRGADETYERLLLQRRIVEALLELDEPYRTAVTMRHLEGHRTDEIARRQGIGTAAARKRVSRGLSMLRERLDREYGEGRGAWSALALLVAEDAGPLAPLPPLTATGSGAAVGSYVLGGVSMSLKLIGVAVTAAAIGVGVWMVWRGPTEAAFPEERAAVTPGDDALAAPPDLQPSESAMVSAGPMERTVVGGEPAGAAPAIDRDLDLHGVVLDPWGNPYAGASVRVIRREARDTGTLDLEYTLEQRIAAEVESNAEGRFAVRLEPGRRHHLVVEADAYALEHVFHVYAGEKVTVRLHHASSLVGWVTRAGDGAVVTGARIETWYHDGRGFGKRTVETDAGGFYRFDGLMPGEVYVVVTSDAGASPSWLRLEVEQGVEHRHDFALEDGFPVRGRVTDRSTGRPIAGAEVGEGWTMGRTVLTDENGEYRYEHFPVQDMYDIYVRAEGFGNLGKTARDPFDPPPSEAVVDFA